MNSVDSFIELIQSVCRRRHMYVYGGSFYEVCAYITGYAEASPDCPLSGEGWKAFNHFVCAACKFPSKYCWSYVLKQCSHDDDEATVRLQNLLAEFAERTKTESYEHIVQEMMSRARSQEEGEPEKTWRRFSRAIHRGSRDEIESLIQAHPDAEVLWSGTYPDDVATLLDQIEESYLVSQISGSENEGEVTIITPDFGPVAMKLIRGSWRIDATKVIDCRKAIQTNVSDSQS
ncbi:MAG: hypothetical protein ACLQLG_13145 [Thermoguttaceae bacterium]